MRIRRGEIWWADLGDPGGSEPGSRRPVLVVQEDTFNRSELATVIVLGLTSELGYGALPGNVTIPPEESGDQNDPAELSGSVRRFEGSLVVCHAGFSRGADRAVRSSMPGSSARFQRISNR